MKMGKKKKFFFSIIFLSFYLFRSGIIQCSMAVNFAPVAKYKEHNEKKFKYNVHIYV